MNREELSRKLDEWIEDPKNTFLKTDFKIKMERERKWKSRSKLMKGMDDLIILGWREFIGSWMLSDYDIDENGDHSFVDQLSRDEKEIFYEEDLPKYVWNHFLSDSNTEKVKYEEDNFGDDWLLDGLKYGFNDECGNTCGLSDKITEYITNNYKLLGLVSKDIE